MHKFFDHKKFSTQKRKKEKSDAKLKKKAT